MVPSGRARFVAGWVVLAAAALGLASCGSPSTSGERTAEAPDLEPFRFSAETLDGGSIDTSEIIGVEPVAFWAWAPWCPTCNREAHTVRSAVEEFGERVRFVGVPGRDAADRMRVFVDRHELQAIPHAVDDDGGLWRRLGVPGQPTWVLVTADGEVDRFFGPVEEGELRRALSRLAAGALAADG